MDFEKFSIAKNKSPPQSFPSPQSQVYDDEIKSSTRENKELDIWEFVQGFFEKNVHRQHFSHCQVLIRCQMQSFSYRTIFVGFLCSFVEMLKYEMEN